MIIRARFFFGWGIALIFALGLATRTAAVADPLPVVGTWEGTLDPGAQPKKRIVVHVSASQDGTLSGTVDFPDQDVSGVLMTSITFKNGILHFDTNSGGYDGAINKDNSELAGNWKTAGGQISLNLKKTSAG